MDLLPVFIYDFFYRKTELKTLEVVVTYNNIYNFCNNIPYLRNKLFQLLQFCRLFPSHVMLLCYSMEAH